MYPRKKKIFNKIFTNSRRSTLAIVAALVLIAGAIWYYESPSHRANLTIPSTSSQPTHSQTHQNSKKSPGAMTPSSVNQSASAPTKSTKDGGQPPSNSDVALLSPWGNFVSNHNPGNGSPTTETSVCNTTPGATCYIKFTNGDQTRELGVKVADVNGTTIWNWDVANGGFSSGSWQITAIASLNNHSVTSTDTRMLVIQ